MLNSVLGIIAIVTFVLTVMGQTFMMIWWASNISSQIRHIHECIHRIDKELEKRDVHIATLWSRLDDVRDMIPTIPIIPNPGVQKS